MKERACVYSETVAAGNVDEAFKIRTLILWGSEFGLMVGFFLFLSA